MSVRRKLSLLVQLVKAFVFALPLEILRVLWRGSRYRAWTRTQSVAYHCIRKLFIVFTSGASFEGQVDSLAATWPPTWVRKGVKAEYVQVQVPQELDEIAERLPVFASTRGVVQPADVDCFMLQPVATSSVSVLELQPIVYDPFLRH